MNPITDKITRILKLEQEKGCQDTAVIGGLESFIQRWKDDVTKSHPDQETAELAKFVADRLSDYASREVPARTDAIKQVMDRLRKVPQREGKPAPRTAPPRHRSKRPAQRPQNLEMPIQSLSGISETYARRLARLGIKTVRDLLFHFPHRYDDYSALKQISALMYGEEVTISGAVQRITNRQNRRGIIITTGIISDGTGQIQATWFNQPYLLKSLAPGRKIVLSGKVDEYLGRLTFQSPTWEPLEREHIHTGRLVPVYPLTEGIGRLWMRRLLKRVVDRWARGVPDPLPPAIREKYKLLGLAEALKQMHFPDNWDRLAQARRRLSFDEFLWIQIGVLRQRRRWHAQTGRAITVRPEIVETFQSTLPFTLTGAQQRSLEEILQDLGKGEPMSRLLQGDVGSGKTVVAAIALLVTMADGLQGAVMAPTEILAEQHYKTFTKLFAENGKTNLPCPTLRLLTGSLSKKERELTLAEIEAGKANIVIGTHAIIQKGVNFHDLGMAIIDEQHRFGVQQRALLRSKGHYPHILVMSATPIPRSLSLTLYGDLDLSVIDEMPAGRQQTTTKWLTPQERERAYAFVRRQVQEGRQAFIICPLVEASDKIEAKAAVDEHARLQKEIFPDLKLGLLHGRMKANEKEDTMQRFYRQELDVLVSTSVVEVGIDVPNASVMLVEGADRFGLAQLHQFRGRVGRGEHKSYCLLLSDASSTEAETRLRALEETTDGFALAEVDMEMRGPGEFFGTRQSGLPDLRVAKLSDTDVLVEAREAAQEIITADPTLSRPEHRLVVKQVDAFWQQSADLS
ncbi:MAG: ATP-dependent DNA helicase RecG [Chloroflexi bacterium]|nr:ATP-dependent DNA helicase RecG [Chloroflexota bacterium]